MENGDLYKIDMEIPLPSSRIALLVYDVLRVDTEPVRSRVTKILSVKDKALVANFSGESMKQLRVAVNGFIEKIDLITETIEVFGPPTSDTYNHY